MALTQTASASTADAGPGAKPAPRPAIDFAKPAGAPAWYEPDSVAWQVYKNPVSLFIGGITAVLLELGEPRVREGVWGHSIFPKDPITRLRRTGLATHVSVYAPREVASKLIGGVVRMHEKVRGTTPDGEPYHANDPVLLDWVQATVGYGFMEAYAKWCRPLSDEQRDRFYAESKPIAGLFGATGAPLSLSEQKAWFEEMRPRIVAHSIVFEFLSIMERTPAVPAPLRPFQRMMIRAAIATLPEWTQRQLGLTDRHFRLAGWERRVIRALGALFERIPLRSAPPAQACLRLGLPANWLYRRRA
ncbi:oxygenase MpaB family protein [Novosphingobium mangrovi (ex Hu et al. 2023)]|uniref:Oxygenase MpaB family protein n=1 Tax=Novosphingobium mangrovi (ex Hu et al. 2023) TaxID=2930094 RepID=A0ABT0A7Z4_9SPHN|nr:oxygenase MpaB family protein [Novosphingobium mangrovi (ex Hu et al. 2023)]MCJ1959325.1 oxygenase MpaB family protein [Novosphingobium mangrovi (ex Hu et al. 2023)]